MLSTVICAQVTREQRDLALARRVCYCELFKRAGLPESSTGSCEKAGRAVGLLLLVSYYARFECLWPRVARNHQITGIQTV